MADIRAGIEAMDGLITLANNANNVGPRDLRQAMQSGMPQATRMARGFLASQYSRSGLKRRTGQLLNMIKRSTVSIIDAASSRVALIIAMPGGMSKEAYKKAGSLNYGAVRGGKGSLLKAKNAKGNPLIGEKQRQRLKSAANTMKASDHFRQVSRDVGVRATGKTQNGSTVMDTTVGQATVTKGFKFYYLTDSQIDKIKAVIFNSAYEQIMAKIKGKSRLRKAA